MKCRLVQEAWVPHEDAVYDRVGNIMLSRIMGADVRLVDDGFDIGIRKSWEDALKDVEAQGGRPYAIPAGASAHKFGGLGYVGFAEEVRAQERELGFSFDYVVVCTGDRGRRCPAHRRLRLSHLWRAFRGDEERDPTHCAA